MTIEKSHGKARPTLPRSSDLVAVPDTVDDRIRNHAGDGRFPVGNSASRGRGWKRAISKMLGRGVDDLDAVARAVSEDAWRLFIQTMRELPSDGAMVRARVTSMVRHQALEAFWGARAVAQLGTPEGDLADDRASAHGQRAERLSVTALDIATRLAKATRAPEADLLAIHVAAEEETTRRRDAERRRLGLDDARGSDGADEGEAT
jgi:hypothetical protein